MDLPGRPPGCLEQSRSSPTPIAGMASPDLVEHTVRLTRLDDRSKSHEFVTRYGYDKDGRLVEKRLPDGLVVIHEYDEHGKPTSQVLKYPNGKVQPIVASMKADALHGLKELTFGNGVVTAYANDKQGRIAAIATATRNKDGTPATVYAQRMTYDLGGRITAIDRNGASELYSYDALDRLVEVRTPQEQRGFVYDAVGNRTAVLKLGGTRTAAISSDLASVKHQSLTYQPGSNRLMAILEEQPTGLHTQPDRIHIRPDRQPHHHRCAPIHLWCRRPTEESVRYRASCWAATFTMPRASA